MKRFIGLLFIATIITSCKVDKTTGASQIISDAINAAGGKSIDNSVISFQFRDKFYKATRQSGVYAFERQFYKNDDTIKDVLSNNSFIRFINNNQIQVADSMALKYSASVNSVHYFSVLPYGLESPAVHKAYLGLTTINGQEFHKIKVTFDEAGGGEDFEDEFIYWVDSSSYKVQYLAYSYNENDGVGLRFRVAYNERNIEGIRIVDYYNYKPKSTDVKLEFLDVSYEKGELELLSKIELKNVSIKLN